MMEEHYMDHGADWYDEQHEGEWKSIGMIREIAKDKLPPPALRDQLVERRSSSHSPTVLRGQLVERRYPSPSPPVLRDQLVERRSSSHSPTVLRDQLVERRSSSHSPTVLRDQLVERRSYTPSLNKFKALEEEDDEMDEEAASPQKIEEKPRARGGQKKVEQDKKQRKIVVVKDEAEIDDIIKEHKQLSLKMLSKISDPINPCTQEVKGWKKLSMAVDSGACENVIDASEEVPDYKIRESKASKMGVKYASATGEEIPNLGEVLLPMMTMEGTKRSMRMQAAEVSKPLASVKRICEAGHTVVFDETGSFMYNKHTGEVNYFREESGNYMLDVWIPPHKATGFGRQ
jgi:hypothetical protein